MKKVTTLFIAIAITLASNLNAQPDELYYQKMGETLQQMGQAKTQPEVQSLVNTFERIAAMNPSEWLPLYYAGLTLVNFSWSEGLSKTEKDQLLDKALTLAEKAEKLAPDESEIYVLSGYALMAKMTVDPMTRGAVYSSRINNKYGKALELNPQNPRALYMKGNMAIGSARFFGSSTDEGCALVKESLIYFAKEEDRGLLPTWGEDRARSIVADCEK